MQRSAGSLIVILLTLAAPAAAQSLGTFRWQLQPYGSVLTMNVTQQGSIYLLNGFEAQCSNPSLPAWGVAVPQPNGTVLIGVTTITEQGNGLHTRASISMQDFSGGWVDNANSSGAFVFNPGNTCPGGPRVSPIVPEPSAVSWMDAAGSGSLDTVRAELEILRKRPNALEAKNR